MRSSITPSRRPREKRMSEKKPKASKSDRVWIAIFSYGWVASWFAAIWIEEYRWHLFWTGLLLLFIGLLAVSGKDYSRE